ncbi:hypothetical protein PHLGIDRAFT_121093 [Phlebiopsis gigantea 11061_1 CR5-6]|uniref:Uncharacterized protein n=1 Tax=Phlebiopsis gigantea (strain 11061_1 CR5-6) TaxID=745531 RepID=A0A0C3S691_PHLG1|nr:hypothetical protein PHLGIDRAFT_121093 [Phlebiopsis gigantea 11061_1 CR5-6]
MPSKLEGPSLKRIPKDARVKYNDLVYLTTALERVTSWLAGMDVDPKHDGDQTVYNIEHMAWNAVCMHLNIHWTARPPQALFDLVHTEHVAIFGERALSIKPVSARTYLCINGMPTHAAHNVPYLMVDIYAGLLNPENTRAAEAKAANKCSAAAAKCVGNPKDAATEDIKEDVVSYTDAERNENGDLDIKIFTGEASGLAM